MLDATEQEQDLMQELLAGHRAEQSRTEKRNARILEQVLENYHGAANGALGVEGTAWAAYNAVSEYADHQATVRGRSPAERADHRLQSVWFFPCQGPPWPTAPGTGGRVTYPIPCVRCRSPFRFWCYACAHAARWFDGAGSVFGPRAW
jgi:hypothetical protein